MDGKEGAMYDGVFDLLFSPDGDRVAYVADISEKWRMVIDGQEGPEYDMILEGSPLFSLDGKLLAYIAIKKDKQFVVVDGKEGPQYDGIIKARLTFLADKTIEYLAHKDGTLYRVKHLP